MKNLIKNCTLLSPYTELRAQMNTSSRTVLVDGNLIGNSTSTSGGVCARVYKGGSYGFASAPYIDEDGVKTVLAEATSNAIFLDKNQKLQKPFFPIITGGREFSHNSGMTVPEQKYIINFLKEIDEYIKNKYPNLLSRMIASPCLTTTKIIKTSDGIYSEEDVPHASMYIEMTAEDKDGIPIDLMTPIGEYGVFSSIFKNPANYQKDADKLYEQLMDKCNGVFADAGIKDCILHPDLAGMLAHEAVGHTVEADFVMSGSVAAHYMDKPVAGELVNMVDFANTYDGKQCPVPVYIDDEGTPAKDVTIIEKGILKGYLHSKESAANFETEPTGNARAYSFSDEPLIRMRNTVILPGKSKLEEMIESIDDGYYFVKTGNGQADSTGEFMFGIDLGYEIKKGKIGKAIKSTTIAGVAFDMLKTVSAVSDDMAWCSTGMCGKKQPISVAMGGPAIKCKINVGGK